MHNHNSAATFYLVQHHRVKIRTNFQQGECYYIRLSLSEQKENIYFSLVSHRYPNGTSLVHFHLIACIKCFL